MQRATNPLPVATSITGIVQGRDGAVVGGNFSIQDVSLIKRPKKGVRLVWVFIGRRQILCGCLLFLFISSPLNAT